MLKQLTINDDKAAAAFANSRTRPILFALMRSQLSLVELQRNVGMSLSLLHYHVTRLKDLGLIEVVETRRRAGRAMSKYRATAAEFLMMASVAGRTAGTGLKQEMEAALEEEEARHPSTICYFLDEHGAARMRRIQSDRTAIDERWWRLRLSAAAARQLSREVGALIAQYENASRESETSHLVHFALAPSKVL